MTRSADGRRDSSSADPWYREGLRFACTQCGNCCSGPPGAVWFTPDEGRAMAEVVGLSESDFLARFTRIVEGRRSLGERRVGAGFDCIFLVREPRSGRASCGIYAARPRQCRTWPFWPENIASPAAWASAKRRTPCPGMDEGPLHALVAITTSAAEPSRDVASE